MILPPDDGLMEALDARNREALRPHFASRLRVRFVSRNANGTLVVEGGDLEGRKTAAQTRPAYVPSSGELLYALSQGSSLLVISP